MKGMNSMRLWAALAGVAMAIAAQAQVNPPSWWNVNDGNTSSFGYTFDDSSYPPIPSPNLNPFGDPTWGLTGPAAWLPNVTSHEGVVGFFPGSEGTISILLPNRPDPTMVKHLWLQVDIYEFPAEGSDITLSGFETDPGVNVLSATEHDDVLGEGWVRATVDIFLFPQPSFEKLTFDFKGGNTGSYMDNFYIGTHCSPVPEPATIAALGLGVSALVRRRIKK